MHGITIRRAVVGDLPEIVQLLADDELGRTREDAGPALPALRFGLYCN